MSDEHIDEGDALSFSIDTASEYQPYLARLEEGLEEVYFTKEEMRKVLMYEFSELRGQLRADNQKPRWEILEWRLGQIVSLPS